MDKRARFPIEFKHEVCKYYDNHTGEQTIAKYGITRKSLHRWRNALGYRNKFFNYNLYTEELQSTVQKRERKNFMITKQENGDLKARIVALETRLTNSDLDKQWLKNKLHDIADAIKTQNDNPVIKLRGFDN
jgi:transposase-like protein